MKSKTIGAAAAIIAATTVLVATACVGEDAELPTVPPAADGGTSSSSGSASSSGSTSSSGGASSSGAPAECALDSDCLPKLPLTTPPNCATATCNKETKKCVFKAKDADNDGHPAKTCTAGTVPIVTGDDCNDADPNTYPGAWDGPSTEVDSGPTAKADRCDQKDNDCNGSPDDGKIAVDGGDKTCSCDPSAPLPCYEYDNGAPIDAATLDDNNQPKGACKKGLRTCTGGVPGKCVGAVGPAAELCDDVDHDCDGMTGNAGDTVSNAPTWFKDADGDGIGDQATTPKMQCTAPAASWKQSIPNTDCDDGDAQRSPALTEVCDGKDNNCNSVKDEGYNVNSACTAGTAGVCKRNGTIQCASTSTTTCSPGAGTGNDSDYNQVASTDPAVYTGSNTTSYNAAWDWNCNGTIEARPDGLINYNYATGTAAYALCNNDFQGACQGMSNSEATCLPVVYPCGQSCGTGCTKAQGCGKNLTIAYCLWDHNPDPAQTCDTYANATGHVLYCK